MLGSVIYSNILTSNGKQTTTQSNTIIVFKKPVLQLTIESFDKPLHIKIDNSDTIEIDINSIFVVNEMQMETMTILDAGVSYRWTSMY